MKDKLKIRQIKKDDLDTLAQIYTEVYEVFDIGEKWTKETAYPMLEYWIKKQPDLCFLCELDGKIMGAFCTCVKPWWDGNHLSDAEFFIHPDYQKIGIGTKLLRFSLQQAIKKYKVIRLEAFTPRDKYPLEWYTKIGFEEIKEWAMISCNPKRILDNLK
ncbi:MAG: GNAT family N-acetyltransferase [Nanoarchaeota archaeon]